jgi:hypothetical protein
MWRQPRLEPAFDHLMALLALMLTIAAYVDAWSRLPEAGTAIGFRPWGDAGVVGVWFLLSLVLVGRAVSSITKGKKWSSLVPRGYLPSLVACAVLGIATILDTYYQYAFGAGNGLEVLLRPTHMAEFGAGAVIVAGPLQAALKRGDARAGLPALVSASLLVSAIAFATQFLSPLVDLWPASGANAPAAPQGWWTQHLGAGAIVLEASLLAGLVLLVVRSFELVPGSLTLICILQGALLAVLKTRWWLIPAPLAAGVIADLALALLKPSRGRPIQAWLLGSLTAGAFAASYLLLLALAGGVAWDAQLSVGVVLLAGAAGWLIAMVLFAVLPGSRDWDEGFATRHERVATAPAVKSALEALQDVRTLGTSPLMQLAWIKADGASGAGELKAALIQVMTELASSVDFRDAQSGRILIDYYVKRIGSHEVVAERNNVSRQTYFRRLDRGCAGVADRLEEVGEKEVSQAAVPSLP